MDGGKADKPVDTGLHDQVNGETRKPASERAEPHLAERKDESPTSTERLMEEICERENLKEALARVKSNQGSPGIDGMTVDQLSSYLKENWLRIREQLLGGTYRPQPVKRVEIPKPDGGMRKLGIPMVRSYCTSIQ